MSESYRSRVLPLHRVRRRLQAAPFIALLSAVSLLPTDVDAQAEPPVEATARPETVIWWRSLGDAQLTSLIEEGLAADAELCCAIARLRFADEEARHHRRELGTRIGRLFGKHDAPALAAAREARIQRIAARRLRVTEQIALAYVDVRRLQRRVDLRRKLINQYRDNAEIAEFRRQAGLVPAIDGALARSQAETARAELGEDEAQLADAFTELAARVGDEPFALAARIGPAGPTTWWPSSTAPQTQSRNKRIAAQLEAARRTVRDARTAYREGAGSLATLYVSEAATLALGQALIDEQARGLAAEVHRHTASDNGWAAQGLTPADVAGTARDVVAGRCD